MPMPMDFSKRGRLLVPATLAILVMFAEVPYTRANCIRPALGEGLPDGVSRSVSTTALFQTLNSTGVNMNISCQAGDYINGTLTWTDVETTNANMNPELCGGNFSINSTDLGPLQVCSRSAGAGSARGIFSVFNSVVQYRVVVYRPPYVATSPKSVDSPQGDTETLFCEVGGYPVPNVTWFVDKTPFSDTRRKANSEVISIGGDAGALNIGIRSRLTITDAQYSDRGNYSCGASNYQPNSGPFIGSTNSTGGFFRVRDRYGAVWPFLGMVGIAVLMFVILYCDDRVQKKKKKTQEAQNVKFSQDDPDGTVTVEDMAAARHRRLSQQYQGDVPLLRANSTTPPHGYSV